MNSQVKALLQDILDHIELFRALDKGSQANTLSQLITEQAQYLKVLREVLSDDNAKSKSEHV